MKTVILTGGSGFIGTITSKHLIKAGYDILNIDLEKGSLGKQITWDLSQPITSELIQSIRNQLKGNEIAGIIHLAAWKDLNASFKDPFEYYRNNVIATINVCELAKTLHIERVIHSSSSAVYSDYVSGSVSEYASTESNSPYGRSKYICETMINDLSLINCVGINLRYQNPIGGDMDTFDVSDSMFGNIYKSLVTGSEFTVYGDKYDTPDGSCIRDYIDVNDLAKVHIYFLELDRGQISDTVYNVGTGKGTSCLEVCQRTEMIALENGIKFTYGVGKPRPGDAPGSWANNTRLLASGYPDNFAPIEDTIGLLIIKAKQSI